MKSSTDTKPVAKKLAQGDGGDKHPACHGCSGYERCWNEKDDLSKLSKDRFLDAVLRRG